ncbi:Na(+)/glucose symporter [Limihaloglobus sulfuriphilus]|uniref:Na(+)/glucose symporter n=1 Tax=Limihaloglobus sulfuriphilus TaxID=1851148 RepID=A0A1Q2MGM8_9BACT|nr:sodium:solute symporter [Limihaloglobus sulfuriphilus]AQQ71688.1 Na(+)/glucose symporter [Limihaloglobus sulfuriphilus]
MDIKIGYIDTIAIVGYFVVMAVIGYICSRKNKSTEEYFVGGRSFGGWVIGLSLVGTSISSISFLAYPADSFKTSWIRYLPNIALPIAVLIASRTFLKFFRDKRTTSAYQFLEARFGTSIRIYATMAFIVAESIRLGIVLYLTSLIVHELTGLPIDLCIIVAGGFVSIYTIVGGIDAVIWTDVLQTLVLVGGGILCLAMVVAKVPGGIAEVFRVGLENNKFSFSENINGTLQNLDFFGPLSEKTIFMLILVGFTTWMTSYSSNQNIIQRYCATRDLKETKKAMWVCVWSSLPIWAFFMFLGTALFAFFHHFPTEETQQILAGERKAEQVLPFFIINYLPSGVTGIVIAATLAAAMSSLDSGINAISTVSVVDIYKRVFVTKKADKHYLKAAWFFASLASVVMIGGALIISHTDTNTLQDTGLILASVVSGGMLGIYILGFFTKIRGVRSVWAGIATTLSFTVWTVLSSKDLLPDAISFRYDLYYTTIFGNLIMFFVGFGVYNIFFKSKSEVLEEDIDSETQRQEKVYN